MINGHDKNKYCTMHPHVFKSTPLTREWNDKCVLEKINYELLNFVCISKSRKYHMKYINIMKIAQSNNTLWNIHLECIFKSI